MFHLINLHYDGMSKCVVLTGFSSSGEEEYPKGEVVANYN